jgi:hypothetical protein
VRAMVMPLRCSSDQRSIAVVRRPETFQVRAAGAGWNEALDDEQTPAGGEDAVGFGESLRWVVPVVERAERPDDGGARVRQRQCFRRCLHPGSDMVLPSQQPWTRQLSRASLRATAAMVSRRPGRPTTRGRWRAGRRGARARGRRRACSGCLLDGGAETRRLPRRRLALARSGIVGVVKAARRQSLSLQFPA